MKNFKQDEMFFTAKIFYKNRATITLIYLLSTFLFATCLFLHGFFPTMHCDNSQSTKESIPTSINNIKLDLDDLYKPVVKKVVIMVIDALRWDFVENADKTGAMPVTSKLIDEKMACLSQVKVSTPTVTMPRIKAMTTGTVSSFIDVALNFGETSVSSDNILLQAKKHGHKLIFYGDDTWLKLYPDIFYRSDGTTSFFVSDYTEVDNNVTRHLNDELNKNNYWSIMILHYLGLDHIGHLYGPQSSLVKPKLQEMDKIIGQIVNKINQWNEESLPSILIVCGDHGMKDSGGHGGATLEETLVPLLTYGIDCFSSSNPSDHNKMEQIDIATTLAILLGLPLPSSNVGSVALSLLKKLPMENKLFVLYYNAKQVFENFKQLPNYESYRAYFDYSKAINLHTEWLNSKNFSTGEINNIIDLYFNALMEMKNKLMQSMVHYNIAFMNAAVILMIQIFSITMNIEQCTNSYSTNNAFYWWISSIIIWFLLNQILYLSGNDITVPDNYLLSFLCIILLTVNCNLCARINWREFFSASNRRKLKSMYLLSLILYMLSLGSSSFIEEEHQTWYFFWTTFLVIEAGSHVTNFSTNKVDVNSLKNIAKILFVLIQHRILRYLNSTGDKYAHLPDISGWIKSQETNTFMTIILLTSLLLLLTIGLIIESRGCNKINKIVYLLYSTMIFSIYQRHAAENSVKPLFFIPSFRGTTEVQIFWISSVLLSIHHLWRIMNDTRNISHKVLVLLTKLWIFISALLHRPYNLILLPAQIIMHLLILDVFRSKTDKNITIFMSYCLGNVFYFYQGNSNSLATIDIAAGYVGLESYNFYTATIFLCVNTFSAPILAYLILICEISNENTNRNDNTSRLLQVNKKYAAIIIIFSTVYKIITTITRYHLFVWTVFSPKLLYNAVISVVFFIVIICVQLITLLDEQKKNKFND